MSLIVEDGSGLANAESYISVADATAYHASRGNVDWAALPNDQVREELLRKATDYMCAYTESWKGIRLLSSQALDWPRNGVWANGYWIAPSTIPSAIANACALLALKAATGELSPDLDVPVAEEKVGPIMVKYAEGARQTVRFRAVELILAPYLACGPSGIQVVRS